MSPPSVVPWKPAITATLPASRAAWMRSAVMRLMRARVWPASVTMPICGPVNEQAGWPRDWSAIARRPIVTCSPVERVRHRGRGCGVPVTAAHRARSRSVVWPIAETTAPARCGRRADSATRRATFLIFSGSATEEPPYFWTISRPMRGPSYTTRARSVKPTSARAAAGAAAVVVLRPDLARRRLPALPHLLAGLLALLGRHGAPPLEVAVQPLALLGGERLVTLEALLDLLAPLRRELLVALVGALELALAIVGELVPALEVLHDPRALARRHLAEALEVLARGPALFGVEALPVPVVLEGVLPLLRRHGAPALHVTLGRRALLRRQPLEALDGRARGRRRRRRLGEGGDRDGEPQRRAHHEREQPGHFAPRGGDGGGGDDPGPGSFAAPCACWLTSMRSRSKRPMRRATSRSRA